MTAYIVALIEVTDPEQYAEYTKHTPRLIAEHGGRFIGRGGAVHMLEGPPETRRVVILEFPSVEAAQRFYDSDGYTLAKALRQGAATGQFFVVEGFPEASFLAAVEASQALSFDDPA